MDQISEGSLGKLSFVLDPFGQESCRCYLGYHLGVCLQKPVNLPLVTNRLRVKASSTPIASTVEALEWKYLLTE